MKIDIYVFMIYIYLFVVKYILFMYVMDILAYYSI